MKQTIEYTPKEVLDIIREHERAKGNTTKSCQLMLEEECEGYGMQERYVTKFNGVRVEIEN
jgi:hypothetical protein